METGINRTIIVLLAILCIAAASLQAETTDYLIFLPRLQQFEQADAEVLSYDQKFRSQVIDRIEQLFSSDGFDSIYGTKDTSYRLTVLEETPFSEGNIFSAYRKELAAYLLSEYQSDKIIIRRYRRVGEFITLEVSSVDSSLEYQRIFSQILTRDRSEHVLENCYTALLEHLIQTPIGTLEIEGSAEQQDRISLSGVLLRTEDPLLTHLPVGRYQLESLSGPRLLDQQEIDILPGETTTHRFPQIDKIISSYQIMTYPAGAELTVEGENMGVTPVSFVLERRSPALGELMHDLYEYPVRFPLYGTHEIEMRPDWLGRNEMVETGKQRLYRHLGSTIISFPISIISMFMYDVTGHPAWHIGTYSGAAVTGVLFTQSVISLWDYYKRIQ
jgi:hypothetical protein